MKSEKPARTAGGLLAALMLVVACGSPSSNPPLPKPLDGRITVGIKAYHGLSDPTGRKSGFEVFARNKILESIGFDPGNYSAQVVMSNNWETELDEERVDLVMGMISDSDPRAEDYGIARSYLKTDIGLLTRAGDEKVENHEGLRGKVICTVQNTTAHEAVEELKASHQLYHAPAGEAETCVDRVKDGEAYAYATDRLILMGLSTAPENVDEATGKSVFRVLELSLGRTQHISMVLSKKNSAACKLLVDGIDKYLKSGDWIPDLRTQLIDDYERLAPDGGRMTDDKLETKFWPTAIDDGHCGDQTNAAPPPG